MFTINRNECSRCSEIRSWPPSHILMPSETFYFGAFDERADMGKNLRAVSKLYSQLERESKAGRAMSEIVGDIYERQPDHKSRNEVLRYLMDKARQDRNQSYNIFRSE